MQITQPPPGSTVQIAPNSAFTVTGTNTDNDEVDGTLYDETTGNPFAASQATISDQPDSQGNYTWTLTFEVDDTIQNNDFLYVDAFDAVTGDDDVGASYQESLPASLSVPTTRSASIQVKLDGSVSMTGVQDITLKVTLQPAGTDGFLFLMLHKQQDDEGNSCNVNLHRYLPPSTKAVRKVTFSNIDVGDWDIIRAIGVVKGQQVPPSVLAIKPKKAKSRKAGSKKAAMKKAKAK